MGLIILAWLVVALLERSSRPEPVFVFAVVYLLALFGICFLIMRQVSKVIDAELGGRELPPRAPAQNLQMPRRSTAQLEEAREPASVTDHTTRTLAEVLIERN
jgi:hypothetical protein